MGVAPSPCGSFIAGQWLIPTTSRQRRIQPANPTHLDQAIPQAYYWEPHFPSLAVRAAEAAFAGWSALPFDDRVGALRRFFLEPLAAHRDELAAIISTEMGKPLPQALEEFEAVRKRFDLMVRDIRPLLEPTPHPENGKILIDHLPYGVTGVISPWNYPLRIPMLMVLASLLTGNTVVLKTASNTPGVIRRMIEFALESGSTLPDGVFNFLVGPGSIGQALAENPEVGLLLFTGSAEVGTRIKIAAAGSGKELTMEMVGQGIVVVLEDADVAPTAKRLVEAATCRNGGQNCNATRMVVAVGEDLGRRLEEAIIAELQKLVIGDPLTPGVHLGPMATDPARGFYADLQAVFSMSGATRVYEHQLPPEITARPGTHYFAQPTAYRIPRDGFGKVFHRGNVLEVFGPALGLAVAIDADEAVSLANQAAGRLSTGVYGTDTERAMTVARRLHWGQVHVNSRTVGAPGEAAFGGPGWATYGGYGGRDLPNNTVWSRRIVLP